VEFATPSVISTALEVSHPKVGRQFLANALLRMVPDLQYAATARRGYVAGLHCRRNREQRVVNSRGCRRERIATAPLRPM